MKYVLDTCIFNKLADGVIEKCDLPTDGVFVATHIQLDELNNTRNVDRRAKLLLCFTTIRPEMEPTETYVVGTGRVGSFKIGDGTLDKICSELDSLNNSKSNNVMDALCAEVALKNGHTLVTTDFDLKQAAEACGCVVLYYSP